jgi:hypothetical protein
VHQYVQALCILLMGFLLLLLSDASELQDKDLREGHLEGSKLNA